MIFVVEELRKLSDADLVGRMNGRLDALRLNNEEWLKLGTTAVLAERQKLWRDLGVLYGELNQRHPAVTQPL
jgi:hypothetical protein